ncbi:MAG: DUF362 domain-containing protein, partial [bacterium]|nr:DUF362 domain-containing protein [bacterium]
EFIRDSAIAGIGLFAGGNLVLHELAKAGPGISSKSRVVICRDEKVFSSPGTLDFPTVRQMVNQSMMRLTGAPSAKDAWRRFFSPRDIIGIKVNVLAGKQLSTHPELALALAYNLQDAGIPANNIIIFDRQNNELQIAGYQLNFSRTGIRCYGTDTAGLGYEPEPRVYNSVGSCFSRILTEQCTALINVPVLKDHGIVGTSSAMKNWYGVVHNPNKYHDNLGDPYIADLSCIPVVKDKMRLVISDALVAQCHGGPSYKPQWSWYYNGLIVATDPVAHDYLSWQIIEQKRKEKGLPSLKAQEREPTWLATATDKERKLGVNEPSKIEVINI